MSGICGIVSLGGQDPGEPDIVALTAAMARRGPDRQSHWRGDRAALGHALLATTPEAVTEPLPLTLDGCTITADVRLDNRDVLIAALGVESDLIGDGELILRAYLNWGEDCPRHLLGDFAFAIWDAREAKLFCARDHMGMRQLIHCHVPGVLFAFATDVEALFAVPGVPRRIYRGRIADFLIDLEGLDFTSTFFEGVYRLPPAHSLVIRGEEYSIRRYWTLRPAEPLALATEQDYATAFLQIFTEAVRCRLRSARSIGAMLSGGMDSGSVVAVAADLLAKAGQNPLATFSVVGPTAVGCPETTAIMAAAALPGISPHLIDYTTLAEPDGTETGTMDDIAEPFDGHMGLIRAIYRAASSHGVNVVLDGVAGDVALHAGNRVASLLQERRIGRAWQEASGEAAFWKLPSHRIRAFLAAAWVARAPAAIRLAKRRIAGAIADVRLYRSPLVRSAFVREVGLVDRVRRFRAHTPQRDVPLSEKRARFILHPHLAVGRERYDRVAAAFGIEPRDPFMDIRLIEFCLAVPSEIVQRDGWPKHLMRVAMRGKLPKAILWRRGKESLGWDLSQHLFSQRRGWRSDLGSAGATLSAFAPDATIRRVATGSPPGGDRISFDLYYLALWLKQYAR